MTIYKNLAQLVKRLPWMPKYGLQNSPLHRNNTILNIPKQWRQPPTKIGAGNNSPPETPVLLPELRQQVLNALIRVHVFLQRQIKRDKNLLQVHVHLLEIYTWKFQNNTEAFVLVTLVYVISLPYEIQRQSTKSLWNALFGQWGPEFNPQNLCFKKNKVRCGDMCL